MVYAPSEAVQLLESYSTCRWVRSPGTPQRTCRRVETPSVSDDRPEMEPPSGHAGVDAGGGGPGDHRDGDSGG